MQIKLMRVQKKINSTKRSAIYEIEVNAQYKNPTSILNPVFELTTNYDEHGISYFNMIFAEGRYYHITDIVYDTYNMCTVSCSIDVLASYRNNIMSTTQYVTRCSDANIYSVGGHLVDTNYIADSTRYHNTSESDALWLSSPSGSEGLFIVGLIAGDVQPLRSETLPVCSMGGISYYLMNMASFNNLITKLLNVTGLAADVNPLQYISSAMYIPFRFSGLSTPYALTQIIVGKYTIDSPGVSIIASNSASLVGATTKLSEGYISIPFNPNARSEAYLYEPWASYKLMAGPFGEISLPASELVGITSIKYVIYLDSITGAGYLEIQDNIGKPFATAKGQIGIQANLIQMRQDSLSGYLNSAMQGVAGAVNFAGGNYLGGISGISGACISAIDNHIIPTVETKGSNGSFIDFARSKMLFISEYNNPMPEDLMRFGRPVFKDVQLSTVALGSFIICENPIIANVDMLTPEKEEIISFLQRGIYLE